jgi:hypothetical protein
MQGQLTEIDIRSILQLIELGSVRENSTSRPMMLPQPVPCGLESPQRSPCMPVRGWFFFSTAKSSMPGPQMAS